MKIETATVGFISLVIFVLSWLQTGVLSFSLMFTVLFVGIYVITNYFIQLIRQVEEKYHLSSSHFEVKRINRFSTKKEKVALKKVKNYKLSRFFLGGYMLSNKGKHLLFFNNSKELDKFEKILKKNL